MKTFAICTLIVASIWINPPSVKAQEKGTVAVIYYWKARQGKLADYNRYIREVAQPIDAEAQRQGAFISVTTFLSQKEDGTWTHMRVFILKDRAQLDKLSDALEAAGVRLEPDETKRKARAEYAATLRDRVSQEVVEILK